MKTVKTKHTPAPWKIVTSWEDYTVEGANGEEIIFQAGNYDVPSIKIEDARLIASAPELLEALKAVVAMGYGDDPDVWGKVFNAIKKAEGTL